MHAHRWDSVTAVAHHSLSSYYFIAFRLTFGNNDVAVHGTLVLPSQHVARCKWLSTVYGLVTSNLHLPEFICALVGHLIVHKVYIDFEMLQSICQCKGFKPMSYQNC